MAATKDALDKTRQEWKDAIADAKRKRAGIGAGEDGPPVSGEPDFSPEKIRKMLAGVNATVQGKLGVTGTFNAAAIGRMGESGVTGLLQTIAENTGRAAREAEADRVERRTGPRNTFGR